VRISGSGNLVGKLDGDTVEFGRVKEPGAWRFGPQQGHFSARHWWLTIKAEPRKIYIFRDKPQEGNFNLTDAITVYNREDIST